MINGSNSKKYIIDVNSHEKIFVNNFTEKKLVVVDRLAFIDKISYKKRVLHFGFLDAPFLIEKISKGQLLHEHLKKVSYFMYGIDINREVLKTYRKLTGDYNNAALNISSKVYSHRSIKAMSKNFDILLFTEILEHVDNAGIAMTNLRNIMEINPESKLVITVPNAFSYGGNEYARYGYEIVHPEHYYYFSPVTLRRLLKDFGFKNIKIKLLENYNDEGDGVKGLSSSGIMAVATI